MTSTSLNLVVSATGLAMATVVFVRRARITDSLFAALLATAAIGSAMIALQHAPGSSTFRDGCERLEYLCAGLSGPLLLLYTRGHVHPRERGHGVAAVAFAAFVPPIEVLMTYQFIYTAWSAATWIRRREETPSWAGSFIAIFAGIHLSQIVRLSFNDVDSLRNVVPTSISLAILGLALTGFQAAFPRPVAKYAHSPRFEDPKNVLVSNRKQIRDERIFAACDLSLDALAAHVSLAPHQLSQLLNEHAGQSFHDFLCDFRLEDFCRLLQDPGNDRFTIEAIGESAGFGSRSGLYVAFRRRMGMTPTRYRRVVRGLSTPAGADKQHTTPA